MNIVVVLISGKYCFNKTFIRDLFIIVFNIGYQEIMRKMNNDIKLIIDVCRKIAVRVLFC